MAFYLRFNNGVTNQSANFASAITIPDGGLLRIRGVWGNAGGSSQRLVNSLRFNSTQIRLRVGNSTGFYAVDMLPYVDVLTTYELRRNGDDYTAYIDGSPTAASQNSAVQNSLFYLVNGSPTNYIQFDLYEAELENSSGVTNRWIPTGTGNTIPDSVGSNNLTVNNLAGDDSEYVEYNSLTLGSTTIQPSDSVTWTTNLTGLTSAYLEDASGNQYALTSVTDTGGTLPALSANLQACLFGSVTVTVSDGTNTATALATLAAPTGYTLTTLTAVPVTPLTTDWVFDFDTPAVVGDQSLDNSSTYTHNEDGTTSGVVAGTYTYFTILAADGVVSEITKTFQEEGGGTPPTANAGSDQSVDAGATVTLDGSGSTGAETYSWTQTSGPSVTLSGSSSAQASFTAPDENVASTLRFELTVTNASGTSTDNVNVSVRSNSPTSGIPIDDRQTWNRLAAFLRSQGF